MSTSLSPRVGAHRLRRHTAVVLVLMVALLAAGTSIVGRAAAGADTASSPDISIVQVDDPVQGSCLPIPAGPLSYSTHHTATTFTLRVVASAPLCESVRPTAAIYMMPGDGVAWPQQLAQTEDFVISKRGTTEITFTKTCRPAQFDVIVGATPQTIAPWGEWHGPLLFPFAVETTYQHWGWECEEPTTTTTEPTTTTSSTTTSTSTTSTSTTTSTTTTSSTTTSTTTSTSTTSSTVPGGGGGCTPGYWKQQHHLGNWVGYAPTDLYDEVFGVTSGLPAGTTLLQALGTGGGGENALARHATAALLNVMNESVGYKYSAEQVISMVQQAYAESNIEQVKNMFEKLNESGCSLGRAEVTSTTTSSTVAPGNGKAKGKGKG